MLSALSVRFQGVETVADVDTALSIHTPACQGIAACSAGGSRAT